MRKQGGASLLFLMLIVALAVLVATWMALPWIAASRNEKIESDLNRGVAPSAKLHPSKAEALERAQNVEFAEKQRGFKEMVGTEHYRALSPRCRELVDAYIGLLDKPADTATDNASVRAGVADIEQSYGAECADGAAAASPSAGAQPSVAAEARGQLACARKREMATDLRAAVTLLLGEAPPRPGSVDEETRERRESLVENKDRLDALEADIAANCR